MRLERYVESGGKHLRCGYTTGSCAAAAAAAAARLLATGYAPSAVKLITPGGVELTLDIEDPSRNGDWARCAVRKDGGDDIDATDGLLVYAAVRASKTAEIVVDGGEGVGRVTRSGLDQPVGMAAINRVPREMIARETRAALDACGCSGGAEVVISVPEGNRIAEKTYNARLGITGGISILGTTGIVEPMSEAALVDTIRAELRMLRAQSGAPVLLTPGNYGETFAREALGLRTARTVLCSNFLGEAFDCAASLGFSGVLLVGHAGKLVKLAGGIFSTHSRTADARMEILTAHAALAGADRTLAGQLMDCPTTDAAFGLLADAGMLETVTETLLERMERQMERRLGGIPAGVVLFANPRGLLGKTAGADRLVKELQLTEETG